MSTFGVHYSWLCRLLLEGWELRCGISFLKSLDLFPFSHGSYLSVFSICRCKHIINLYLAEYHTSLQPKSSFVTWLQGSFHASVFGIFYFTFRMLSVFILRSDFLQSTTWNVIEQSKANNSHECQITTRLLKYMESVKVI